MASETVKAAPGQGSDLRKTELKGSNTSEDATALREIQARNLTRRSAMSVGMAMLLAPLIFGEARQ